MRKAFAPQVSIVTGGASGIGKAIAAELVARGSHVVIADLDLAAAQAAARKLGPRTDAVELDVVDAAAVRAVVDAVVAEHGRLDVMVNNAGIGLGGLLEELDERHWDKAIDVNLRGVVHGVTAAYTVMRRQGSGHILNTASLAGLIPAPSMLPYTTTKHAVVGLSTALRAEAAALGIRVSVLCPGFVDTPLLDSMYEAPASFGGSSVRSRVRMLQPRFLTAEHTAKTSRRRPGRRQGRHPRRVPRPPLVARAALRTAAGTGGHPAPGHRRPAHHRAGSRPTGVGRQRRTRHLSRTT